VYLEKKKENKKYQTGRRKKEADVDWMEGKNGQEFDFRKR